MVWWVFALLAALSDAVYFMLLKKRLKNINPYLLAGGVSLTTSIILFFCFTGGRHPKNWF